MKSVYWLMPALIGVSLFGVACGSPEPGAVEETEPTEDVEPVDPAATPEEGMEEEGMEEEGSTTE